MVYVMWNNFTLVSHNFFINDTSVVKVQKWKQTSQNIFFISHNSNQLWQLYFDVQQII